MNKKINKAILVALEDEFPRKALPSGLKGFHIAYTGVGKINAAFKTAEIINEFSPALIINYGTAGSLQDGLSGLVEATQFFQRDMTVEALGFETGETPFDDIIDIDFGRKGHSCGTGDSFVTQAPKIRTDIVDMEAYAIAKICHLKQVDFRCFKYISDNADEGAATSWQENIAKGKTLFAEKITAEFA